MWLLVAIDRTVALQHTRPRGLLYGSLGEWRPQSGLRIVA